MEVLQTRPLALAEPATIVEQNKRRATQARIHVCVLPEIEEQCEFGGA